MADDASSRSGHALSTSHLRYVGAALAYLVAGIHLFHPERGFPRLVLLASTDNLGLLLGDPRPLLFVVSGLAIIAATMLFAWGAPRKPLYAGGIALMVVYVGGYVAWHLSGHGGFLPGREPIYHDVTPVEAVVDHLLTYPIARLAVITETLLAVVLVELYRRED